MWLLIGLAALIVVDIGLCLFARACWRTRVVEVDMRCSGGWMDWPIGPPVALEVDGELMQVTGRTGNTLHVLRTDDGWEWPWTK